MSCYKIKLKLNMKSACKPLLLFFLFLILFSSIPTISKAQSNWEAGLRFGEAFGIDATIPIAASPRLHPALYFGYNLGLATYFDWMFSLSDGPEGLRFYPGVGPEIYIGDNFDAGIAGNFGVEYIFDFPLTIALDWRPGFIITDNMNFHSGNWGISARFRFNEGVKLIKSN
jgi:hypothetical protein